ncbi:MAG: cytochrome b/b6 domain-containing protein [Novosphingobium sp.]|nr:cytochrome b/b6 domain-containing protein [Novosphingobium sp.]
MAERLRHSLLTRAWHWLNVVAVAILFFSGLNISNAHPRLYWGEAGFEPAEAWLHLPAFPAWMTIPGYYSLAEARAWHFLAAWPFAFGLLVFLVVLPFSRHGRDFVLRRRELSRAALREDVARHLKLDFAAHGGAFNLLQKYLYILVLFVLLPLMILTGLTLSPAMDAAFPWLLDVFGGRQSARSLHFVIAWALFGFVLVHIAAVLLSGPVRQVREMITGGRAPEAAT